MLINGSHRIELEPAFILHRWPYRNTSLIVEFFTEKYGRFAAVARSARGPQSRYKGILMPFTPMLVSWSGKHELKILNHAELAGAPCPLDDQALLCGFYLNELLMRLLEREEAYAHLFSFYQKTLGALLNRLNIESALRCFEKQLLHELGYGIPIYADAETEMPIEADAHYRYIPENGFIRCEELEDTMVFSGKCLIALQREQFDEAYLLKEAKYLMRLALSRHLGKKPLKSRELLV